MGSCVSAYKNSSAIPLSPIKPTPVNLDEHPPSAVLGSKEDDFVDSKPWLDSDCEDDFYSVRGDFTPSRGNTPVHHSFSVGSVAQFVKAPFEQVGSDPATNNESSSGSQKEKLGQHFSDGSRNEGGAAFGNGVLEGNPVAMTKPTILGNLGYESVHSTEMTPDGDSKLEKEKSVRSLLRCLPGLTYCSNFGLKD